MNTKQPSSLILNVNLDLRVFFFICLLAIAFFLYIARAQAQGGIILNTNNPEAQPAPNQVKSVTIVQTPLSPPAPGMLPTTNGEWIFPEDLGEGYLAQLDVTEANATTTYPHYLYLTKNTFATNKVLIACATGYHMASLWEILDISNPIYDVNHPDAFKRDDSGYGPPSDWNGWVRTGVSSNGDNLTGTGNCKNWSSTNIADYGVSIRLSRYWETAPGDMGAWDTNSYTCNYVGPVWCVKN